MLVKENISVFICINIFSYALISLASSLEDTDELDTQIHHLVSLRTYLEDPLFKKTNAGVREEIVDPLEIKIRLRNRTTEKIIGKMINYNIQVKLTRLRYVDGVNINAYYIVRRKIDGETLKITFQPVLI